MKKQILLSLALLSTLAVSADNIALNCTAIASSGDPSLAVDGNEGTRWESAQGVDPQDFQVDLGEAKTFNSIQMVWEAAYASSFTITAGNELGDDGYVTGGTELANVSGQLLDNAFPNTQTITLDAPATARYIHFQGTKRATDYGYSFWEFRVLTKSALPDVPAIPDGLEKLMTLYSNGIQNGNNFYDWGGCSITDDDVNGTAVKKIANFKYCGQQFPEDDYSNYKTYHLDILPTADMTLGVVMIYKNASGNGQTEKGKTVNLKGNEWNSIEIPVQDFIDRDFNMSNLFQIKFVSKIANETEGGEVSDGEENADGSNTLYVGNEYFYGTRIADDEAPVLTKAEAGEPTFNAVTITANATDNNTADITYIVKDGDNVLAQAKGAPGEDTAIELKNLEGSKEYTLTVVARDAAGNESEAQTVTFTTAEAPVLNAAPTPDKPAGDVKAIYSDAYTPATTYNYGYWGQSTTVTPVNATDNTADNILHLTNYNYLGFEFATDVDLKDMTYLHIDVMPMNDMKLGITPVMRGGDKTESSQAVGTLTVGKWNSFDIPLSQFGLDFANFAAFQLKLDQGNGTDEVYVDNIYFWKEATVGDTEAPVIVKAEVTDTADTKATITVNATDNNNGELTYSVKNGDEELATVKGMAGEDATLNVAGLTAQTEYALTVTATDAAGNVSEAQTVDFTTTAAVDDSKGSGVASATDMSQKGVAYTYQFVEDGLGNVTLNVTPDGTGVVGYVEPTIIDDTTTGALEETSGNSKSWSGMKAGDVIKVTLAWAVANGRSVSEGITYTVRGVDTGINAVSAEGAAVADGNIYTINGQLVAKGASVNSLPRGLYIVNGKKIVVK